MIVGDTLTAETVYGRKRPETLETKTFPLRARLVLRMLGHLQQGSLHVHFPDGQSASFGSGQEPQADIRILTWDCFDALFRAGDIGFAESYIGKAWTTRDLAALLDVLVLNRAVIDKLIYGSWWGRIGYRLRHLFNRNSRAGSRRNIHAHYDIGNDFYRLWLDAGMTYSSALFDPASARSWDDLPAAQDRKYQRLLSELRLAPGASVLEIGCGWGGFAETALRAGMTVTGLTLSTEQLGYAQARCAPLTAPGQMSDLRLQDYRDCTGQYDAIASIEMFEAVGEAYWPVYFAAVKRNLKPGGRACIQTITIAEDLFPRYRRGTDFIQQYIFPGGMLPSPSAFRAAAAAAGLRVVNELAFGPDYARTLDLWRNRFLTVAETIRAQGFDARFLRIWDFYFCYCAAAFRHANTDVMQFTLVHDGEER